MRLDEKLKKEIDTYFDNITPEELMETLKKYDLEYSEEVGNSVLIKGDVMKALESIPDNSVDMIITSPPYNKKFFTKGKVTNQIWKKFKIDYASYDDNMPIDEYEEWMIQVVNLMVKKIKPTGSIFFNHKPIRHDNQIYHPLNFLLKTDAHIYQEIVWNRKNSPNIRKDILLPCTERVYWLVKKKPYVNREALSKQFRSEVWEIAAPKQKSHPAPFPEELVENCILLSTKENDIVLDPFMGSGTAGVVANKMNRRFIGVEIDDKYYNITKERIGCLQN